MKRMIWSPAAVTTLRNLYPHYTADAVARVIGCSITSVWSKAKRLGIGKSAEFLASQHSGRVQRGQQSAAVKATQFKPGQRAWNKGTSYQPGGRCAETQFKPGEMRGAAQHNYVPVGSLRINGDGYLERKMNDSHPTPSRRWVGLHRLVWEQAHGPIAKGHMVVFKPGMRTNVEALITTDRLECITRAENAMRNHPRSKSPELARLVQLKGAITRQVNRISREHTEQQKATV